MKEFLKFLYALVGSVLVTVILPIAFLIYLIFKFI